MDLDKLIGKNIYILEKVSKTESKKAVAYTIHSYKKEFENEKMNRYNFLMKSQLANLIDINIKLCTKNKELKEIYFEIVDKTRAAISENSFLKEAILVLRQIDKKVKLDITPILYHGKIVYNISINDKAKGTFYNEKMSTIEILKEWGVYEKFEKGIDFYLVGELRKENSKKFSKELFDNPNEINLELALEVAQETEDKDKVYPVLRKLFSNDDVQLAMKFYKYFNYFNLRHNYIKIFNGLEKDKLTKNLVLRWFKEEFKNPFIVNDPNNFSVVYSIEFKDAEPVKKQYIEKLEGELIKFWSHFEKKINSALEGQNFKVALYKMDFLLNELYVKAISTDDMKPYVLQISGLGQSIKNMVEDFTKVEKGEE